MWATVKQYYNVSWGLGGSTTEAQARNDGGLTWEVMVEVKEWPDYRILKMEGKNLLI